MEHVVFYPSADGSPAFCRVPSLPDAVNFAEHLRNSEGVTEFSVHALTEVELTLRPYYRVEVTGSEPLEAPVAAAAPVADVAPVPTPTSITAPAFTGPVDIITSVDAPDDAPADSPAEAVGAVVDEVVDTPPVEAAMAVESSPEVVPMPVARRTLAFFARS
jgi:hypothetical protein